MTAKEFLQQVKKIDLIISNKIDDANHLEDIALSVSAPMGGDKVKSTPNPHRTADVIEAYCDIDREIEELKQKRKEIISVIEQLALSEYDLLYKIYIEYHSLSTVATLNEKSYSWADKLHKKALNNLQIILDEKNV